MKHGIKLFLLYEARLLLNCPQLLLLDSNDFGVGSLQANLIEDLLCSWDGCWIIYEPN